MGGGGRGLWASLLPFLPGQWLPAEGDKGLDWVTVEHAPPPASRASDPLLSAPSWKGPVLTPGLSHSRTMSFCLSFHLSPPSFSVFLQMQSAPALSLHLWRSLSDQDGWGSSRCGSAEQRWVRWLSLEGTENLNFLSNSYINYILKWSYLGHTQIAY